MPENPQASETTTTTTTMTMTAPSKLVTGGARHLSLALIGAIALVIWGSWIVNAAAEESVVALPTVHVVTKAIHFHHKRALLVESIAVSNIDGALRVSCDRCRRYSTKIHSNYLGPAGFVRQG